MYRRFVWVACFVVAAAFLAACGGGSSGSSNAACPPAADTRAAVNGAVTVCAFDIKFDVKTITTPAGPLAVTFVNKGALQHTFQIENTGFELVANGKHTKTGTVTLAKGTYKFRCTVAGHEGSMHGEVVVS